MKPVLTALISATLILSLAACKEKRPQRRRDRHPEPTVEMNVSENAAMPTSVPAAYEQFPADVRAQIYRSDMLTDKCSGDIRSRDEAACAQRDKLAKELLAKGWCFGGSDDPGSAHWLLCAEDYPGGEGWVGAAKGDDPLGGEKPDQ